MSVDKVYNAPNFHVKTKDLYSQLQVECQQQISLAQKKLGDPIEEEMYLKYEFEKRKLKQMSDHYATMQQMTKVDESQRDLEQKNPGFVVS